LIARQIISHHIQGIHRVSHLFILRPHPMVASGRAAIPLRASAGHHWKCYKRSRKVKLSEAQPSEVEWQNNEDNIEWLEFPHRICQAYELRWTRDMKHKSQWQYWMWWICYNLLYRVSSGDFSTQPFQIFHSTLEISPTESRK
jgi:hypothetical protein